MRKPEPIWVEGVVIELGGAKAPKVIVELTREDAIHLGVRGALYQRVRVVFEPKHEGG